MGSVLEKHVWAQTELDRGQQTVKAAARVRPSNPLRAQHHQWWRLTTPRLGEIAIGAFTIVAA